METIPTQINYYKINTKQVIKEQNTGAQFKPIHLYCKKKRSIFKFIHYKFRRNNNYNSLKCSKMI